MTTSKILNPRPKVVTEKAKRFNVVLQAGKRALDSIGMPFHLHFGTALGAHREHSFIEHDDDIDVCVFHWDANTPAKRQAITDAMLKEGFEVKHVLGRLDRGMELAFRKNGIGFDIFWIYEGEYRGEKYYIVSSYFGRCNDFKYQTCVFGARPYKLQRIRFLGEVYQVVPQSTLVDTYGEDWRVPKNFDYFEGLTDGYKGLLKDYYEPSKTPDNKIAFCFMLMDQFNEQTVWERFFKQDDFPVKSYSIHAHVAKPKRVNGKYLHPKWIEDARVKTIPTEWCDESLFLVFVSLLKAAYADPKNKYFALLSGDCIPLYEFWDTYSRITRSKKSRVNFSYHSKVALRTGLGQADQWMILNRKCAKLLIDVVDTREGQDFMKHMRTLKDTPGMSFCPDETYPIEWFTRKLGGSVSSPEFQAQIRKMPSTYTHWSPTAWHPTRINNYKLYSITREAICDTQAVFGRKFTKFVTNKFAMKCSELNRDTGDNNNDDD